MEDALFVDDELARVDDEDVPMKKEVVVVGTSTVEVCADRITGAVGGGGGGSGGDKKIVGGGSGGGSFLTVAPAVVTVSTTPSPFVSTLTVTPSWPLSAAFLSML